MEVIITAKPNEKLALAIVNDDYEWASSVEFMNAHPQWGAEYAATGHHVYGFGYAQYGRWDVISEAAWEITLKPVSVDADGVADQYEVINCEQVL